MNRFFLCSMLGLAAALGGCKSKELAPELPPYTSYSTPDFDFDTVQRIVLMPVGNRSDVPELSGQMQRAIATELQRSGRFEVVMARNDNEDPDTRSVFTSGTFDEASMLKIHQRYQAQGIMFAEVTQYHGYNPPRLGLNVLLVSPAESVVVASIDGLWDLGEAQTLRRARAQAKQSIDIPGSLFGEDRLLDSPNALHRFVAYEVAQAIEKSTLRQVPIDEMGNALPEGADMTTVSQPAVTAPSTFSQAATSYDIQPARVPAAD